MVHIQWVNNTVFLFFFFSFLPQPLYGRCVRPEVQGHRVQGWGGWFRQKQTRAGPGAQAVTVQKEGDDKFSWCLAWAEGPLFLGLWCDRVGCDKNIRLPCSFHDGVGWQEFQVFLQLPCFGVRCGASPCGVVVSASECGWSWVWIQTESLGIVLALTEPELELLWVQQEGWYDTAKLRPFNRCVWWWCCSRLT